MERPAYSKVWISHAELVQGGTLVFELGPRPNPAYGSARKGSADMIDFTGIKQGSRG